MMRYTISLTNGRQITTHPEILQPGDCISLIGMAGAGKTTVGCRLAALLDWAHLDTDRMIEAYYARPLQEVLDCLQLEQFRIAEERIVAALNLKRSVISTGGSVIYGPFALDKLRKLGPVIFLKAGLETVSFRIGDSSNRGLAKSSSQSIEDVYNERLPLYERAAHYTLETNGMNPEEISCRILDWISDPT